MTFRPRPPVIVWLVGIFACCLVIACTRFTADMSAFLPRSPSPTQQILVDQIQTGVASHLVLVAIDGSPTATLAVLSKELGTQLRQDNANFTAVNNGDEGASGPAPERDLFWHNRYILSSTVAPERFSAEGLHQALETDLGLLGSDMSSLVKQSMPDDPTGEILTILAEFADEKQPTTRDGVWFSPDGQRALLVVQTRRSGFDIADEEKVLASIETTFATAQKSVANAAAARLLLSGPGVFAVHTKSEMKEDISRLSLIATFLISVILLCAYRSSRILVLALVPVASGALAGVAAVSLGFGFVHGITLGFGVTLIGEAVDYAIYLFTQTAPGTSPDETLPRIWPMLRLGVLVSVCGFSAMLFSNFTGFAQLGLFSITGLLVALAVTRWVLPAIMARNFATARSSIFAPTLIVIVANARTLRLPAVIVLAGAVLLLASHRGGFWEDDLTSLSPIPAPDQKLDQSLRAEIGAPDVRYIVIASASDEQQALVASDRLSTVLDGLKGRGLLAGYDAPTRYLPSAATQQARLDALPGSDLLRARLDQALQDTPFQPDLFDPFIADVAAAKSQPLLDFAALQGTPLALKFNSLLVEQHGTWTALLPLRDVTDAGRVATGVEEAGTAGATFVDLKVEIRPTT